MIDANVINWLLSHIIGAGLTGRWMITWCDIAGKYGPKSSSLFQYWLSIFQSNFSNLTYKELVIFSGGFVMLLLCNI